MNVTIIGGGRVGLPVAAGLAMLGHCVVCCECDTNRRNAAAMGRAPFVDKGLDDALAQTVKSGALRFCADVVVAVANADAVIVSVPVSDEDSGLEGLQAIVADVVAVAPPNCVLAIKSTVLPGTCAYLQSMFNISIVANPEFLRQGHGFNDFISPSRIVIGGNQTQALQVMRVLYTPLIQRGVKYIETNHASAEIAKLASNMFLSSRITLINETADLCEASGGYIADVTRVLAADKRIGGDYLQSGIGFGGTCLPKDGRLLMSAAQRLGVDASASKAVYDSNQRRIRSTAERIMNLSPKRPTIAVWGVSFKPDADSISESPAISIIHDLCARGCQMQVHEPLVDMEALRCAIPLARFFHNKMAALVNADVLAVMNKHASFMQISYADILLAMKGRLVFDYADIFDRGESLKSGLVLHTLARQI